MHPPMRPAAILESALYASDLDAARAFYEGILGLEVVLEDAGRFVFFRCGAAMLLIFDAEAIRSGPRPGDLPIPRHGAVGPGHLCFRATSDEIAAWQQRLSEAGVEIEELIDWPGGGRSIYFRDPAGNSLEFAEPRLWGLT